MGKHIKQCIICKSDKMRLEWETEYYEWVVVCDNCKTNFNNDLYQSDYEETIKWFNNLPRKE